MIKVDCIIFFLTFLFGFSHCNSVIQTPLHLFENRDESPTIECSHTVKNYDQIYWYKQTQSQELTLLGYVYGRSEPKKEPEFETKVDMTGDGYSKVSLTIINLSLTDSAVYFCAAYYTVLQSCSIAMQKGP
ncbi:hypothetical protein SRHO_G00137840 [Serrasalmus rhombeus]